MRNFLLLTGAGLLALLSVVGCARHGGAPFPEIYGADARHPPVVLGELHLSAKDAAARSLDHDALEKYDLGAHLSDKIYQYRNGPVDRMPPGMSFLLAHITREQAQQPLTVVVDYAGVPVPGGLPGYQFIDAPIRVDALCAATDAGCALLDPRVYSYYLRGSHLWGQNHYSVGLDQEKPVQMLVDGKQQTVNIGRLTLGLSGRFPVLTASDIYFTFWGNEHFDPAEVRVRLVEGALADRAPPMIVSDAALRITVLVLVLLVLLTVLRLTRSNPFDNPDPPKSLGLLVAVLGAWLAAGGWQGDSLYFLVVGLLFLLMGRLVYFGQALALPLAAVLLVLVWAWSFQETGHDTLLMAGRVTLPTLLCCYPFSRSVSDRLGQASR